MLPIKSNIILAVQVKLSAHDSNKSITLIKLTKCEIFPALSTWTIEFWLLYKKASGKVWMELVLLFSCTYTLGK